MKTEQINIIESVLRHCNFNGLEDRESYISQKEAAERIDELEKLKPNILKHIPKDYTKRIRNGLFSGKEVICALRQLLRYTKQHRLVGQKKQNWNKQLQKSEIEWRYRII
jgi:hypothetical protein